VIPIVIKKGNLKVHNGSVHENKKSYLCLICHFTFSQKASFKTHIESVHKNKKHISAQFVIIFVHKNVI